MNGFQTGSAYLVYGGAMGGTMALADADVVWRGNSYPAFGDQQYDDMLGADVATGDLDGDAYADILLGAPADWIGDPDGGRVRVIYGAPRD